MLIKLFVWLEWISGMLIFVNPFFLLFLFIFNPYCFTDPILSGMPRGCFFSNDKFRDALFHCYSPAGCSAMAALKWCLWICTVSLCFHDIIYIAKCNGIIAVLKV